MRFLDWAIDCQGSDRSKPFNQLGNWLIAIELRNAFLVSFNNINRFRLQISRVIEVRIKFGGSHTLKRLGHLKFAHPSAPTSGDLILKRPTQPDQSNTWIPHVVCKFKHSFIAKSTPIGLRCETLIIECTQFNWSTISLTILLKLN